ncbi:MAG: hypothetical protein PHQ36_14195 [Anaerolineales bacterium]|nr:hypothetical protein [Anaerolineales bacterium]
MFYISSLELTLTCALIAFLFVAPIIVKRTYAQMDKRLKDVEKKIEKKK